jgi:hypothetical protein
VTEAGAMKSSGPSSTVRSGTHWTSDTDDRSDWLSASNHAKPRNTIRARPSRTMSVSERRPTRAPRLALGMVVSLSTIRLLAWLSPLSEVGWIGMRNNGASVDSVVRAHTVTEFVASN